MAPTGRWIKLFKSWQEWCYSDTTHIAQLKAERDRLQEENKRLIEQLNYYAPPMPTSNPDTNSQEADK